MEAGGAGNVVRARQVGDFSWLVAGRLFRLGASVVVGAWVARYLAPSDFGELSFLLSIVALLSALGGAGLDGLVVRELVRRRSEAGEILGTAIGLRVGFGLVLYAILLASWAAASGVGREFWMVTLLGVDVVLQSGNVFDLYFQARTENKWPVLAGVAAVVVSSVVRIALIAAGATVVYFAAAVLVEGLVLAGCLAGLHRWRRTEAERWRFSGTRARLLLAESWPMIVSAAAIAGCMRMDQVILKWLAGEASVGVYAAAARLGEAWYFVPMFAGTVLNPWILEGRTLGEAVYRQRLIRLYAVVFWGALGVAAVVFVTASPLIRLLYGAEYAGAVDPLRIHVAGGVFLAVGMAAGKWFVAEGHTVGLMRKALCGLAVNLAGNMVLIPKYGVAGAALAAAAGHFAANVVYDLFDARVRPQLRLKLRAVVPWRFGSP